MLVKLYIEQIKYFNDTKVPNIFYNKLGTTFFNKIFKTLFTNYKNVISPQLYSKIEKFIYLFNT